MTNNTFRVSYNVETIDGALSKYLFFMKDLKFKIDSAKEFIQNTIKTVDVVSKCVHCSKNMEIEGKKTIVSYLYDGVSSTNFLSRECKHC